MAEKQPHNVFKQGLYPYLESKAIGIRESMLDVDEAFDSKYKDLVLYDGKFPSQLFVVGRDLGKDEVEQGKPFVGDSGKLLRQSMKLAGLDENEMFITNVVPYKPFNNEVFPPTVRSSFGALVDVEIKIGKPRFVISVGKESTEFVLKKEVKSIISLCKSSFSVKQQVKTFGGVHSFDVIPIPHPSYYLRQGVSANSFLNNEEYMELCVEKFKKIAGLLNSDSNVSIENQNGLSAFAPMRFLYDKEGKLEEKYVLVLNVDDKYIGGLDISKLPERFITSIQTVDSMFRSMDEIKGAWRVYKKDKIKAR